MNSKRKWIYHGLLIIFLAAVFIFGLIRATNEYRWSGWAPGDAQTLSAAHHLADEGFIEHYFLPYFHPGYMGAVDPSPVSYEWWFDGYYTHSPPLYVVINGVILELGGDRYTSQAFSIFLSSLALLFWYIFASYFFRCNVALLSTVFIGLSVVFLEHMDSLWRHTYDIFLVFATMALFVAIEHGGLWKERKYLRPIAFSGVWFLVLLQSLNSFEYVMFLPLFFLGYYFLRKTQPFPYKKLLFFISAPVIGLALHFTQIVWVFGSIAAAWSDIVGLITERVTGTAMEARLGAGEATGFEPLGEIRLMNTQFINAFGLGMIALLLVWLLVRYLEFYQSPQRMLKLERGFTPSNVILWLIICLLPWRVVFFEGPEIYQPGHAFAVVGLLLAFVSILYFSNVIGTLRGFFQQQAGQSSDFPQKVEPVLLKFGVTTLIIVVPILLFTINSFGYLSEYPNLISSQRTWLVHSPPERIEEGCEVSGEVKEKTSYGDIVFHNLGSEWVFGAETLPLFEWYGQRRSLVLGYGLQQVKTAPIVNRNVEKAYNELQPSYIRYDEGGGMLLGGGGLPDDGFLHTYVIGETGVDYVVGVKNFKYRLAKLRELRQGLIESGKIGEDEIKYYALINNTRAVRPLQRYLLNNYFQEPIDPRYTLVHLDKPNSFLASLEAYWPLDDNIGSTAYDISGFRRHLSLSGSYLLGTEGKVDLSAQFSRAASGEHAVAENDSLGLYLEKELTLTFWMYPEGGKGYTNIIELNNAQGSNRLLLGYDYNQPRKLLVEESSINYYSRSEIPLNSWTHVALTFDQSTSTLQIYLNGTLDAQYEGVPVSFASQFFDSIVLGNCFREQNNGYNGHLDEIIIFSQALDSSEINTIYQDDLDKDAIIPLNLEQIAGVGEFSSTPSWIKCSPMNVPPDAETISPWTSAGTYDLKTASNGILTLETSGSNFYQFHRGEPRFNNKLGLTAEIKMKVIEASSQGFQGACFAIQDGKHEGKITFYPDHISIRDKNDEKATYQMNTMDDFHIYRLTMAKDMLKVYVDNSLVASVTLENTVPDKGVLFGDLSSEEGENIHAEIDYVIYDVEEALVPMSRPAGIDAADETAQAPKWNSVRDMNQLVNDEPDNPWATAGVFDIADTFENMLTVKTSGSHIGYFGRIEEGFNNARGSTAELELRLVQGQAVFAIQDGVREGRLAIYPDHISIQDRNDEKAVYDLNTVDDLHTYRLAMKKDTLNVYVDGDFVESITLENHVLTKALLLGDLSPAEGNNMHAQVKYISYTTEGALDAEGQPMVPPLPTGSVQELAGMPKVSKFSDLRVPPDEEEISPWGATGTFAVKEALKGLVTIKTTGNSIGHFTHTDSRFSNDLGLTIELKMKLLEASERGFQGACIAIQNGARECKITFYPDHISIRDVNTEKATHMMDTTDDFHIYRLVVVKDTARLYVDAELVASVTLSSDISSKLLMFGDLSMEDGENIHAQIDYVAYTAGGAFDPTGQPYVTD